MSSTINEKMEHLDELIRKVHSIIYPEQADDMCWLMDKNLRLKMLEKHPKCFISLADRRNNPVYLPICNRSALTDPRVIDFSMKMVDKMSKNGDIDPEAGKPLMIRLKKMKTRYNRESPKTPESAAMKAKLTRFLKSVKNSK